MSEDKSPEIVDDNDDDSRDDLLEALKAAVEVAEDDSEELEPKWDPSPTAECVVWRRHFLWLAHL